MRCTAHSDGVADVERRLGRPLLDRDATGGNGGASFLSTASGAQHGSAVAAETKLNS